jgi:hypothetical protein
VLNRLRASIIVPLFPQLNITAPFLGREGIRLALEGEASTRINTMTGGVQSPEPYRPATITATLLKTQFLSNFWKEQEETNALLGDIYVRSDTSGLPSDLDPYDFTNCAILGVRELDFSGGDAGYRIVVGGYYNINSALFF